MKKPVQKTLTGLSIALAVVAVLLILAIAAFFILSSIYDVTQVGNSAFCLITKDGETAVIFGFGKLWDYAEFAIDFFPSYSHHGLSPFYLSEIKKVIFCYGITNISYELLSSCHDLEEVYIPSSVKKIDSNAFWQCSSMTSVHFGGNAPKFVYLKEEVFSDGTYPWNPFDCLYAKQPVTIYYQPGTTGWDSPDWEGYNLVAQKYCVDWS